MPYLSTYRPLSICQWSSRPRPRERKAARDGATRATVRGVLRTRSTARALDEDQAAELADVLKVLADPARLRLLSMVASAAGEACACDLVEPVGRAQPTVSHHLSVLVDAGLLEREQRGRWAWYRVVPERLAAVRDVLAPAPRGQRSPTRGRATP